jgi:hypothetical protein
MQQIPQVGYFTNILKMDTEISIETLVPEYWSALRYVS